MPNTSPPFNPAYSTISAINIGSINILKQNTQCLFERLELVENVNEIFPTGVVIVKDFQDIVSFIKSNSIDTITIQFFNGNVWKTDITSVSYINNAASDTEEALVGIYITNPYYKKAQQTSMNSELGFHKPKVFLIDEFVTEVATKCFNGARGWIDYTDNYVVYKPTNTISERQESVSDNAVQYLNYLSTYAVDIVNKKPNYMFWTEFDGSVNFKYFYNNVQDDSSYGSIDSDYRRIAVFDGESVIQKLTDGKQYRKAYFYTTNPGYQFISKNYYYINKTPKILDVIPSGLCADNGELDSYIYKTLSYQFQDEGQKYNIQLYVSGASGFVIPGSDQLFYDHHWGYFDGGDSINDASYHTHLGQDFGTTDIYAGFNFMGSSGYMPYVDNTEMWKNMFDLTAVHPNIPNAGRPRGSDTNLQKVIDIRYNNYLAGASGQQGRLEFLRNLEIQNFIMYSLCCMGQRDDCFFAVLQRYEVDNTKGFSGTNNYMYRYKWNKIIWDPTAGLTGGTGATGGTGPTQTGPEEEDIVDPPFQSLAGPSGASGSSGGYGPTGATIYFHHLESWVLDSLKSGETQDESWAINVNERGLSADYLPPGWIASPLPTGFRYRAIGAKKPGLTAEDIKHIARICKYSDGLNYFYYFIAENVVDGIC